MIKVFCIFIYSTKYKILLNVFQIQIQNTIIKSISNTNTKYLNVFEIRI